MVEIKEEVLVELCNVDMPPAQRLLRAGFKQVTAEEMRERFCCDAITKKYNEKLISYLE